MLFQTPNPMVEERDDRNPSGNFALAALRPPSSFQSITAGKEVRPCFAEEVRNKNDEGPLNGHEGRFKLDG